MDLTELRRQRMNEVRLKRKGNAPKKPEALYTLDHLISVVQLRLSNALQEPLKKSDVKAIIKIVLLSIVDLAKDDISLFIQGIFKVIPFSSKGTNKKLVKFKLSNVLVNSLTEGTPLFPDDTKLKTMEELQLLTKHELHKESAITQLHLRDRVKQKLGLFIKNINTLKKDLTYHVKDAIIDNVNSKVKSSDKIVQKGGDSNEVVLGVPLQGGTEIEDDWSTQDLV